MAMSTSGLTDAIKTELTNANINVIEDDQFDSAISAIAGAIVSYIQDNATVTVASGSSAGEYPVA